MDGFYCNACFDLLDPGDYYLVTDDDRVICAICQEE